jgi:hypothetical protein
MAIPLEQFTAQIVDIGLVVGDGTEARTRFYRSNKASGMNSDVPSEARRLPVEWVVWELE